MSIKTSLNHKEYRNPHLSTITIWFYMFAIETAFSSKRTLCSLNELIFNTLKILNLEK